MDLQEALETVAFATRSVSAELKFLKAFILATADDDEEYIRLDEMVAGIVQDRPTVKKVILLNLISLVTWVDL
jgi:hypothetical protein